MLCCLRNNETCLSSSSRPRVGRAELRGLLGDLTLEAAEGTSLGSRAALSPVRAPMRQREALGVLVRPIQRDSEPCVRPNATGV